MTLYKPKFYTPLLLSLICIYLFVSLWGIPDFSKSQHLFMDILFLIYVIVVLAFFIIIFFSYKVKVEKDYVKIYWFVNHGKKIFFKDVKSLSFDDKSFKLVHPIFVIVYKEKDQLKSFKLVDMDLLSKEKVKKLLEELGNKINKK
jgi:hypothetical protein